MPSFLFGKKIDTGVSKKTAIHHIELLLSVAITGATGAA
jgi:hypothetical protein